MSFDLKIINNNLSLNPDGSLQTVRDNEKLAQDILKIVLTSIGSNKVFRWYGCTLGTRVIGNILEPTHMEIEVQRSIQQSISNLIALQKSQSRVQYVSAGETIASVREIVVLRNDEDPRLYEIGISVLTRKLTLVEETFILRAF